MALSWPDVDSLGLLPSDACFIWCFVSTSKSPSSNSAYKIPCKSYLRWDFDDYSYQQLGFSIKKSCWQSNPKSPGLLFWVFYTLEESSLQQFPSLVVQNQLVSVLLGPVVPSPLDSVLPSPVVLSPLVCVHLGLVVLSPLVSVLPNLVAQVRWSLCSLTQWSQVNWFLVLPNPLDSVLLSLVVPIAMVFGLPSQVSKVHWSRFSLARCSQVQLFLCSLA